jgi:hypothetical protein
VVPKTSRKRTFLPDCVPARRSRNPIGQWRRAEIQNPKPKIQMKSKITNPKRSFRHDAPVIQWSADSEKPGGANALQLLALKRGRNIAAQNRAKTAR